MSAAGNARGAEAIFLPRCPPHFSPLQPGPSDRARSVREKRQVRGAEQSFFRRRGFCSLGQTKPMFILDALRRGHGGADQHGETDDAEDADDAKRANHKGGNGKGDQRGFTGAKSSSQEES